MDAAQWLGHSQGLDMCSRHISLARRFFSFARLRLSPDTQRNGRVWKFFGRVYRAMSRNVSVLWGVSAHIRQLRNNRMYYSVYYLISTGSSGAPVTECCATITAITRAGLQPIYRSTDWTHGSNKKEGEKKERRKRKWWNENGRELKKASNNNHNNNNNNNNNNNKRVEKSNNNQGSQPLTDFSRQERVERKKKKKGKNH
jgi:hypothetical protein